MTSYCSAQIPSLILERSRLLFEQQTNPILLNLVDALSGKTKPIKIVSVKNIVRREQFKCPVYGAIRSPFGYRRRPRRGFHAGIDIGAKKGTSIRVVANGTVTFAGTKGSYGRLIIVRHSGGITSLYAHCQKILVKNGQKVSANEQIATVGSSGRATGPHLHFEVRNNGKAVDPLFFFPCNSFVAPLLLTHHLPTNTLINAA